MPNVMIEPMKILLVDDHVIVREIVTNSVKAFSLPSPDEAGNGTEALTKIKDALGRGAPYDLVFLDWNMEPCDGMEVLKACRENKKLAGMAIVMLTAESEQRNVIQAIKAGATGYVVKPFTSKKIKETLLEIAEWKQRRRHP